VAEAMPVTFAASSDVSNKTENSKNATLNAVYVINSLDNIARKSQKQWENKRMLTRQQYMDNEITHQQYYGQFVDEHIIKLVIDTFGSYPLKYEFQRDENFNDIPLQRWDALSYAIVRKVTPLLREAGDFYSLAGGVCILKQAARMHVEAIDKKGATNNDATNRGL
jgi:hypothetical protein